MTVRALTEREGGSAKCIRASERRALAEISGLSRRGFALQYNKHQDKIELINSNDAFTK